MTALFALCLIRYDIPVFDQEILVEYFFQACPESLLLLHSKQIFDRDRMEVWRANAYETVQVLYCAISVDQRIFR